jgi:hypothetical protein
MIGPVGMNRASLRSRAAPRSRSPPGLARAVCARLVVARDQSRWRHQPRLRHHPEHDERLADLPAAVSAALERSKSLVVEFLPNAYSQGALPGGGSLRGPPDSRGYIGAQRFRARAGAARADRPRARVRQQAEALGRAHQPARAEPAGCRAWTRKILERARTPAHGNRPDRRRGESRSSPSTNARSTRRSRSCTTASRTAPS